MADLTSRQERFAVEYIKDGNATQAAVRAGFSERTAYSAGARLLKNVGIAARIVELRAPIVEAAGMTLEGHLAELQSLRELSKAAKQMTAAIQAEVSRGKVAGFYTEKKEVRFPDGGGVLLVPAATSPEDWAAQVAQRQAALAQRPSLAAKPEGE